MKKYQVLRDNHGFQGRYWRKDEIVDFDDSVTPPRHFKMLAGPNDVKTVEKKMAEEKAALSSLARKEVKPLPTAGNTLKNQKKAATEPVKGDDF